MKKLGAVLAAVLVPSSTLGLRIDDEAEGARVTKETLPVAGHELAPEALAEIAAKAAETERAVEEESADFVSKAAKKSAQRAEEAIHKANAQSLAMKLQATKQAHERMAIADASVKRAEDAAAEEVRQARERLQTKLDEKKRVVEAIERIAAEHAKEAAQSAEGAHSKGIGLFQKAEGAEAIQEGTEAVKRTALLAAQEMASEGERAGRVQEKLDREGQQLQKATMRRIEEVRSSIAREGPKQKEAVLEAALHKVETDRRDAAQEVVEIKKEAAASMQRLASNARREVAQVGALAETAQRRAEEAAKHEVRSVQMREALQEGTENEAASKTTEDALLIAERTREGDREARGDSKAVLTMISQKALSEATNAKLQAKDALEAETEAAAVAVEKERKEQAEKIHQAQVQATLKVMKAMAAMSGQKAFDSI